MKNSKYTKLMALNANFSTIKELIDHNFTPAEIKTTLTDWAGSKVKLSRLVKNVDAWTGENIISFYEILLERFSLVPVPESFIEKLKLKNTITLNEMARLKKLCQQYETVVYPIIG